MSRNVPIFPYFRKQNAADVSLHPDTVIQPDYQYSGRWITAQTIRYLSGLDD